MLALASPRRLGVKGLLLLCLGRKYIVIIRFEYPVATDLPLSMSYSFLAPPGAREFLCIILISFHSFCCAYHPISIYPLLPFICLFYPLSLIVL